MKVELNFIEAERWRPDPRRSVILLTVLVVICSIGWVSWRYTSITAYNEQTEAHILRLTDRLIALEAESDDFNTDEVSRLRSLNKELNDLKESSTLYVHYYQSILAALDDTKQLKSLGFANPTVIKGSVYFNTMRDASAYMNRLMALDFVEDVSMDSFSKSSVVRDNIMHMTVTLNEGSAAASPSVSDGKELDEDVR